jgi:hypothetical protein
MEGWVTVALAAMGPIGAVLGAFTHGWLAGKADTRRYEREERWQMASVRRATYARFLGVAGRVYGQFTELTSTSDFEKAMPRITALRDEVTEFASEVSLISSPQMQSLADDMVDKVADVATFVTETLTKARARPFMVVMDAPGFAQVNKRYLDSRNAFVRRAQKELGTPIGQETETSERSAR